MSSTTLGVFFFLSKGVTTPLKPIYKCHGSQQGICFHFFSKVPQLSLNLTNVVNNDGF
jgi:hypothetical protein